MLNNIQKILILKWGALGDVVAATPAIKLLIDNYPSVQIDVVADTMFKEIFPPGETFYRNFFNIRSNKVELLKQIRKQKYDLVVNLKWTSEGAAWITLLSGAQYRAGSGPESLRFIYNLKSDYMKAKCHEIIRNLEIIKGIGIKSEKIDFISYIDELSERKTDSFLYDNNLNNSFLLGVHPGASKKSKAWDPERFSMVIDKITDDYDIKVIIFYGINERETAEMLVRKSNSSNVLIGPETKSIRELAAMMTKCNLFFCNNSGPMNLAVSLGIPTVALLGSTHPMDWGPYGKNHVSIKSPLYLNSFTENDELAAMKAIRTDKVLDILRKKISELSTNK